MKYTTLLVICLSITINLNSTKLSPEVSRIKGADCNHTINDKLKGITNPIGLKKTKINWDFEIKNNDTNFEQFICSYYGLRAGIKNLYNSIKFKKVKTNYQYIRRHNPESKYIKHFFKISKLNKRSLINNDDDFIKSVAVIIFLETSIKVDERELKEIYKQWKRNF